MVEECLVGSLVCLDPKWYSLFPPILALILALITKNVVVSLSSGMMLGTIVFVGVNKGNFFEIFSVFFEILVDRIGVPVIFFTSMLGSVIYVMSRAGGTQAYGEWSKKTIKTKWGAKLSTSVLGCLICFDDYFSTIASGTVMRPVTDILLISREKLAYLVDSLGASLCVIQPISTWSAVIISTIVNEDEHANGILEFSKTIPYNFYAILAILTVFYFSISENDFGPMKGYERKAILKGELSEEERKVDMNDELSRIVPSKDGTIWDLVAPILFLVIVTIIYIIFLGGGFSDSSKSVEDIFGDSDAALAMSISSALTIVFCAALYLPRKLMNFVEFMEGVTEGMKSMLPICLILVLAWGIGGVSKLFQTGEYLGRAVENGNFPSGILPFLVFIISALLAFSIGTAWGTFGILLPIAYSLCRTTPDILTCTQAAVLSGSIFGDHCSPISDTTVMSSTSAGCPHMNHVSSQLPYAITTAVSASIGFLIAGLSRGNLWASLPTVLVIHGLLLFLVQYLSNKGYFSKFEGVESPKIIQELVNGKSDMPSSPTEMKVSPINVVTA